jgi:hypothetical protein
MADGATTVHIIKTHLTTLIFRMPVPVSGNFKAWLKACRLALTLLYS